MRENTRGIRGENMLEYATDKMLYYYITVSTINGA
jgi:hypothetical protein